jgi:peptidylprolyl isomerase
MEDMMKKAAKGDTIKANYTGRLTDGTVFDSSEGKAPLEFEIGTGKLIAGFENGVIGMQTGNTKEITIDPEDGYGKKIQELIAEVPRDRLPDDLSPEVGQKLQVNNPNGQSFPATVTQVNDDSITLDANHPLAGKTLVFEVEVVDIS